MGKNEIKILMVTAMLIFLSGCLLEEDGYIKPEDPAAVREITQGLFPSISPDGKLLAFSRNGAIFISDTGGKNSKQLTSVAAFDVMPQWSPDGGSVGFIRKSSSNEKYGTLTVVDTGSLVVKQISEVNQVFCLTEETFQYAAPPAWSWSPTATFAAFFTGHDTLTNLSIISADGSRTSAGTYLLYRKYAQYGAMNSAGFFWLPTGNQIVCTSNAENDTSYLYRITVGINTMVRMSDRKMAFNATGSADGRFIGFKSQYEYRYAILDQQTGFVSLHEGISDSPKLSPDGKKIVYYYYYYSGNPDGYSQSNLICLDVSTGLRKNVIISYGDRHFAFHPSSQWIFACREGIIRKAPLP